MTRSELPTVHATAHHLRPDGEVCGFHVLRRVHAGERTHAFLARDARGGQVVLRTFPGTEGAERASAEINLSSRVHAVHLQESLDAGVSSAGDPVLVCERLGSRLSQQLEGGGHIAAGSVVTLAAPLAAALRDLHISGSAHGAVDVAHVRLATDGRPVLVGADGGLPATPSNVRSDLDGLACLITVVLEHTDERSREHGLTHITAWLQNQLTHETKPSTELYVDLECRIFALAEPLPFAVGRDVEPFRHRDPARRTASLRERGQDSTMARLLEGELSFSLPLLITSLRRLFTMFVGTKRKRQLALVAVIVFVISAAGALLLVPQASSADESQQTSTPSTALPIPAASTSLTPVDALNKLLSARADCLETSSPSKCLSAVFEPTSPALSADLTAATSEKADPFPLLSLDEARRSLDVRDETGGAVVVVVTGVDDSTTNQPVSVLLVKTETGWLIRDVFDA